MAFERLAFELNAVELNAVELNAFERNEWFALLWIAALLIVAVAYLIQRLRQSDYGVYESCLYAPTYLLGRLLWRVHFVNAPPSELKSGALLVANHRSSVDPFFVQLAARRRVHWLVAKEYCDHPLFGPLLRTLQVIPTNRSGLDTAATKHAIRLTRHGRLVGMFPEGRLNHTKLTLLSIRSGAALIATRSSVPIIPLFIHGSPYRKTVWSPILIPARVAITFGSPIYPSPEHPHMSAERDSRTDEAWLATSDELIVQWAKQIVAMASAPDFPIELASKRKRRPRPSKDA